VPAHDSGPGASSGLVVSTPHLILYGKPDCHLCDEMKGVIDAVRREVACTLEVIDVSADPALLARYGEEIPVLLVDDRKAFKYRTDARALRRRLGA